MMSTPTASIEQAAQDDDWPPYECRHCGEVIEQPTNYAVFHHRLHCQKVDIGVKRLNAQNQIKGFTHAIEKLDDDALRSWLRMIDQMDPDEAGRLADYLDTQLQTGEYPESMKLVNLELQLWAYRRRATGAKVFPYRKG